jgi:hypothetical protein
VRARVPTHDEIVRAGLAEQQGHDLPTLRSHVSLPRAEPRAAGHRPSLD